MLGSDNPMAFILGLSGTGCIASWGNVAAWEGSYEIWPGGSLEGTSLGNDDLSNGLSRGRCSCRQSTNTSSSTLDGILRIQMLYARSQAVCGSVCRTTVHVRWTTFPKLLRSEISIEPWLLEARLFVTIAAYTCPPFAASLAGLWDSVRLIKHQKQEQARYRLSILRPAGCRKLIG